MKTFKKFEIFLRNFTFAFYLLITVPTLGTLIVLLSLCQTGKRIIPKIQHFWLSNMVRIAGVRLEVRGLEHIRPEENYIFAANHQSQFDIPVIGTILPHKISWLAKKSLFKIPFFGWGLLAAGCVPIDRENPRKGLESLMLAVGKTKEGFSVLIFPEGTRSPDGRLQPFKVGGFILAIKSGLPVVPIAICGTREVLPKGKLLLKPGLVRVKIFPPIPTKGLTLRDKHKLAELVRLRIADGLKSGCR
ncbi:lysophospholipid acyltransferase family protein [Thermodesulfatator atlanticus]